MKVYKYRGGDENTVERDIKTLEDNMIYCSPLDKLNDVSEAKFMIDNQSFKLSDIMFGGGKGDGKAIDMLNSYTQSLKNCGVYSLSKVYDHDVLWANYSANHTGFCIEYDLDSLINYKLKGEYVATVKYDTKVPTIKADDFITAFSSQHNSSVLNDKLFATKSKKWMYEDEIRIITGEFGLKPYRYDALKAIYFGVRAHDSLIERIMWTLRGRQIKYFKMQHGKYDYQLSECRLIDLFLNEKYPGIQLADFDLNDLYISSGDLIHKREILKAIEVVRRRPESKKIIDASLSNSKSTSQNLIFVVTYISILGEYENYFISKEQLRNIEGLGIDSDDIGI